MSTSGEGRTYPEKDLTCEQCGYYQTSVVIYDVDDGTASWNCAYCEHPNVIDLF